MDDVCSQERSQPEADRSEGGKRWWKAFGSMGMNPGFTGNTVWTLVWTALSMCLQKRSESYWRRDLAPKE